MWVYFATSIKRLHDRDKSGWWMVPFFVGARPLTTSSADRLPDSQSGVDLPIVLVMQISCLWGFVEMYCLHGSSRKTNRFGADPLAEVEDNSASTPPARWDQQSEIEMVAASASPPPVWRVKRSA